MNNRLSGLKVMAIGAHPDDIECCMAGALLKFKKSDCEIFYVVATDGRKGGKVDSNELVTIRKNEAKCAASYLKVDPIFLDLPDGELTYDQNSYNIVKELILQKKPDIVFTHNPRDYHPDHRNLSNLVNDASSFRTPVIYADSQMGVDFTPQFYIDITEEFELKSQMLLEHKSQLYFGLSEMVQLLNKFRGVQATGDLSKFAEAYAIPSVYKSWNIFRLLPFYT